MGEFKVDMFNGQGILLYSNGNKTIGTWENNKRNGIELLFNNKGQIFFRVYENNTLVQEKQIDGNEFLKDFKNFNQEQIMEYMSNFYIKQLKKRGKDPLLFKKGDIVSIKVIKIKEDGKVEFSLQ
jgi:hypothetical protein